MNGGTQERAERRELSLAGYVICSSASIQHRLLFSISPSTTFYKAKTRHFPSGILCEGKKKDWQTDSFYSLPIQFHPIQLLTTAGIFCPCFKHWTRQLPAKKLHFLFDSRILSHFFFVSIFLFPFFIQEAQLVRIERVRCIYNKRNMTRVRGGVFFFISRRNLWRHVRGGRRTFSLSLFVCIFHIFFLFLSQWGVGDVFHTIVESGFRRRIAILYRWIESDFNIASA